MWNIPPSKFILRENDIHIWLLNNQAIDCSSLSQYLVFLSSEELKRLELIKSNLKREQFIKNRLILKFILAEYLNISPQKIVFQYNLKGKPFLNTAINNNSIYFNLSHKNHYTIYTIARQNIGVDLEKIDHNVKIDKIAKRFFYQEEYEYLTQLNKLDKIEYFFKLWTIKEAYFKLTGEGLSAGLNTLYLDCNNHLFKIKNNSKILLNVDTKTELILDDYIMTTIVEKHFSTYNFEKYSICELFRYGLLNKSEVY